MANAHTGTLCWVVPACVGLLALLTPFGREATLPPYFVAYRLLLPRDRHAVLLVGRASTKSRFSARFLRDGDRSAGPDAAVGLAGARPTWPWPPTSRSRACCRDGPIHEQLIGAWEAVLELDPFLPFVTSNLAESWYRSGQPDAARRMLERAIELEPNYVGAWLKLARWRESEGYTDEGRRLRARALAIVEKYRHQETLTEYEAVLLSRSPGGIRGNGGAGD